MSPDFCKKYFHKSVFPESLLLFYFFQLLTNILRKTIWKRHQIKGSLTNNIHSVGTVLSNFPYSNNRVFVVGVKKTRGTVPLRQATYSHTDTDRIIFLRVWSAQENWKSPADLLLFVCKTFVWGWKQMIRYFLRKSVIFKHPKSNIQQYGSTDMMCNLHVVFIPPPPPLYTWLMFEFTLYQHRSYYTCYHMDMKVI